VAFWVIPYVSLCAVMAKLQPKRSADGHKSFGHAQQTPRSNEAAATSLFVTAACVFIARRLLRRLA
jgi:hypothetical protein